MKTRIPVLALVGAIALCVFSAKAFAHPTKGIFPLCTFLSVTLPDDTLSKEKRIYHPGLVTWNRDYPYGTGTPPALSSVEVVKPFPNPNDLLTIQITAKGGTPETTDNLTTGAQRLMYSEIAYSFTPGSWHMNQAGVGPGVPMDYFKRDVLRVLNDVGKKWKTYQAPQGSWAVSLPFTPAPTNAPAPNRRGAMPAGFGAYAYEFPWNYPCPYGNNCPLWDDWGPVDTGYGVDFLAARPATCTKGAGNCNVPGFPEGGGDFMDYFPQYDPVPGTDFPNIPGEPIVRVNGVPGISCGVYNGDDGKPRHPLCEEFPDEDMVAIYDDFGIYAYTLNPDSGKVMFVHQLTNQDVVDAAFYVYTRGTWTARVDLAQAPFSAINTTGGAFEFFPRVIDTCGNLATGTKSPPFPSFNPTNNENSYVGVEDFHWDLVPTDQDAMIQALDDRDNTDCGAASGGATEQYCPGNAAPEDWNLLTDGGPCPWPECECCYNECAPTSCTWNSPVYNSCVNVGDAGNAPGCGHEFQGKTGMAEIHNLKVSHSSSNIYLKMETAGEIVFGCYGSWYPIIGCEVLNFGDQASKFTGYTFRIMNQGAQAGTYFLVILPDIPIYGEIVLFLDLNALISGGLGSNYKSCDLESYADGGACNFCNTEGASEDPCEELGCDPIGDPDGDCDGDAIYGPYSNSVDPCPCEDGGPDTSDGCPPEDPDDGGMGLDEFMCKACTIEKQNNKIYVEMAIEGQIQKSGEAPYEILGMVLGLHDFEICKLLEAACFKNFSFAALASDQAPRINYYHTGDKARKSVSLRPDVTAPEAPRIKACLGRCDEAVTSDTADNDADPIAFEDPVGMDPNIVTRIDEGYDPTATEIEIKFPEVIFNTDSDSTFIRDLAGYKIYVSRGQSQQFQHYYTVCSMTAAGDCDGHSPLDTGGATVARDNPAMDEPYAPNGRRFSIPADETKSLSGWNFPREKIACVMDADCDIPGNGLDDDKDGLIDEGCYTTNCYHDNDANVQLAEDGQTYNFRTLAYDMNGNQSQWSNTVTVTILRNTTPPMKPVIRHAYQLSEGRSTKVVWDLNPESDMGGYVVYRCPARPIDAVIKTEDGTLADYCENAADADTHYRVVSPVFLHQLNKHMKDDGLGYFEGGVGAVNAEDTCDRDGDGNPDQIFGDDNCNWDPATDDVGMDGQAATTDPGEADGLPTPGEPNAYEWIDCATLSKDNPDLKYCGNMDPAWNVGDEIYDTDGETRIALYQATDSENRPVLFYTGLVDGYTYYYKVKAIDSPYRGDGLAVPGTCDNGKNSWRRDTKQGCVNPIEDTDGVDPFLNPRNCDDPHIKFNWVSGGNCSVFSDSVSGVPADTQAPAMPASLKADGNADGTTVNLTWSMLDNDITLDHFRVYRSNKQTGPFACVHGGCQTAPYIDGCQCQDDADCNTGSSCTYAVKVCTNPPDFTIQPQPNGCGTAPYNDGCQCNSNSDCKQDTCSSGRCTLSNISCTSDAQCTASRTCTFQYKSCQPTGVPMAVNDGVDNDGDGTIDEENVNGVDDDGDGLVDEDQGQQEIVTLPDGTKKYIFKVGACPVLDPDPAAPLKYVKYESMSAVDYGLLPGRSYFYRVAGVDNAVYDPPEDDAIYDVHPPNEGEQSTAVPVQPVDAQPPSAPTGACADPVTAEPEPCVEVNTTITPRDDYGGQLTITWLRNSEDDIIGYNLYRAVNLSGTNEPPTSQYEKVNQTPIAQPDSGTSSVYYKDSDLVNGTNYFYMVTALDSRLNESGYSEVAGPTQPQDLVAPSAPRWDPLYRTPNIGCPTAARPSNCTTELATDCVSGGVFSDGSGQAVVLQWAPHKQTVCDTNSIAESDFTSFNIYRSETPACTISVNNNCNPGFDCKVASGVTNTYYRHDDDVLPGVTYYYCISAVDRYGNESPVSEARSVKPVDASPPGKPTGLTATPLVNAAIGLGWNKGAETDIAGWRIYRSQTGLEGSFSPVTLTGANLVNMDPDGIAASGDEFQVVNALKYNDLDLVADTTYYYRITAVDNVGNEGKTSDTASARTTVVDTTAPGRPATIAIRAGFDLGETGAGSSDGLDSDADGFIDDANLRARNVEIHWDRITAYDVASYNIYRLDPPDKLSCTCDPDNNPLGDCDNDGLANNVDDCVCMPKDDETDPFRSAWTLVATLDSATACPSGNHVRPDGKLSANSCLYTDKNNGLGLCNDCQYWYQVLGVDSTGNISSLDAAYAWPTVPRDRVPANNMDTPDKPKTEAPTGGSKLIVKVKPLDTSLSDNENVIGYMIWRDTKANGAYSTKLTTINDLSKVTYCDATQPEYFCIDDISVINDTRYYYKVSAYDRWGRESEKSAFGFGTPSINGQPADVTGLKVQPDPDDNYKLKVSWTPRSTDTTVAGYRLLKSGSEAGPFSLITPGNPTADGYFPKSTQLFVDSSLTMGQTYCYMIFVIDTTGAESPGVIACGVPGSDTIPPARPESLTATSGNASVQLKWTANSEPDLAGYRIYKSVGDKTNFVQINSSLATYPRYNVTGLINDTVYWFKVTAVDLAGNESQSSPLVTSTPKADGKVFARAVSRGWNLVTIPLASTESTVVIQTQDPIVPARAASKVFSFSSEQKYIEIPSDNIVRTSQGLAFWYFVEDETDPLFVEGQLNTDTEIEIALQPGWNLVGNPFVESLPWSNDKVMFSADGVNWLTLGEAASGGFVQHAVRYVTDELGNGEYRHLAAGTDSIPAGHGFWLKIDRALTLLLKK